MITDEMIAEAVAKYNDALVQYWQNVEMEEHEFSPQFERKMRRLIWKVKYPYMHKALRSVACILIAFLISFASVLTFNVEARAAFTRWIREVYEDSIVYEFFGEKSETASLDYRVTWVPEGYELVEEFVADTQYGAKYRKSDSNKDIIIVNWYLLSENRKVIYQTSGVEYDCYQVSINGCAGSFYQSSIDSESNGLIWIDDELGVGFNISSFLQLKEMIKIAENIKSVLVKQNCNSSA